MGKETDEQGGESLIIAYGSLLNISDSQISAAFTRARDEDYLALGEEIRAAVAEADSQERLAALRKFEKRLEVVRAIDFFPSGKGVSLQKMLDDGNTDFVIVGTGFMLKECDVNADGKINDNDVKTVQNLSADIIKTECSDEEKFVLYSADLDDNGKININDATALQQKMTA